MLTEGTPVIKSHPAYRGPERQEPIRYKNSRLSIKQNKGARNHFKRQVFRPNDSTPITSLLQLLFERLQSQIIRPVAKPTPITGIQQIGGDLPSHVKHVVLSLVVAFMSHVTVWSNHDRIRFVGIPRYLTIERFLQRRGMQKPGDLVYTWRNAGRQF